MIVSHGTLAVHGVLVTCEVEPIQDGHARPAVHGTLTDMGTAVRKGTMCSRPPCKTTKSANQSVHPPVSIMLLPAHMGSLVFIAC